MDEGKPLERRGRRRARRGSWRRGRFRQIDDSSRGDDKGGFLFGGFEALVLMRLTDALERRRVAPWVLAVVFFVVGAWSAFGLFRGGEEGIGSLGWMAWGAVGVMLGAGFWLAAIPYRRRSAGKVLRLCAAVAALAPIAIHLLGVT